MHYLVWMALLVMIVMPSFACRAQEIGNPGEGRAFAKQVCSECHAIETGAERSPKLDAPTFEEIAATPGMTATALSAALQSSHRTMPNLVLKDDMANVIAYILSLKPRS